MTFAVQHEPRGTADAVRARGGADRRRTSTVIVLNGDVPLITSETIAGLCAAHERQGAAATMLTAVLDDPSGYGRVVRAPDGTVERVVETKEGGDATELELHIREVNTGVFAFDGGALLRALERVRADNAQGELYLPDVLPILRDDERTVAAFELEDPDETLAGQRSQRAWPRSRAVAQRRIHDAPHARRRDDRRPGRDGDRRRRRDRRRHRDRAVHEPARDYTRSVRDRRSARTRR